MLFSQEKIKERINQNLILENNRSRQHVKQQLCDKPRHRLNDKRKLETKKSKWVLIINSLSIIFQF